MMEETDPLFLLITYGIEYIWASRTKAYSCCLLYMESKPHSK